MSTLLFAALALAAPVDTIGAADIERAYVDVVDVRRHGASASSPIVVRVLNADSLPDDHLLRAFLDENALLFAYLVMHAKGFDDETGMGEGDAAERETRYHAALLADSIFRGVADPLVAAFLRQRGHVVTGVADATPRTVELPDVQTIAVRFFYPDTMAPGGQFGGHICVGKNGLDDFRDRDHLLEAIAYSALMRELMRDASGLYALFRDAIVTAQSLRLSTDPQTALARAQGVVWRELQDEPAIGALLSAYMREREAWLPVRLT